MESMIAVGAIFVVQEVDVEKVPVENGLGSSSSQPINLYTSQPINLYRRKVLKGKRYGVVMDDNHGK